MATTDRATRAVRSVLRAVTPKEGTPKEGTGPATIAEVVAAYAVVHNRPIEVRRQALPVGVFGMWIKNDTKDVLLVSNGVATFEQTLAHELGHLVLGHEHGCSSDPNVDTAQWAEHEAEKFATLLVRRVRAGATRGRVDSAIVELLG